MTGGRAEHRGDERDAAGALRLSEEIGRRPALALAVGPEPGALEQHDERHAVRDRELGHAIPLRVRGLADRPGFDREVLGRDPHRPPLDATGSGHDRVGRRRRTTDQRAELVERPGVEQVGDPGPDIELPRGVVLRQPLRPTHGPRGAAPVLEVVEHLIPTVGSIAHEYRSKPRPREKVASARGRRVEVATAARQTARCLGVAADGDAARRGGRHGPVRRIPVRRQADPGGRRCDRDGRRDRRPPPGLRRRRRGHGLRPDRQEGRDGDPRRPRRPSIDRRSHRGDRRPRRRGVLVRGGRRRHPEPREDQLHRPPPPHRPARRRAAGSAAAGPSGSSPARPGSAGRRTSRSSTSTSTSPTSTPRRSGRSSTTRPTTCRASRRSARTSPARR